MSFLKDPDSTLDFMVDWSPWLTAIGDTISTSAWAVETGDGTLTIVRTSNTTTGATVWLAGGTVGVRYRVRNRVTTAGGRTDDRSISVAVANR